MDGLRDKTGSFAVTKGASPRGAGADGVFAMHFSGKSEVQLTPVRAGLAALGQLTEDDFVDGGLPAMVPGAHVKTHACGAVGCTSGWMKLWRKRRRPVFEGEWGCSSQCLAKMVRQAVTREAGDGDVLEPLERHQHRVPLGLVLLAQGWITHPQLQAALAAQRLSGRGRIGDWLKQSCGLEEDRITRGLGVQWGCPVLNMDGFSAAEMALVMPKQFVAEFGLVPLRIAASAVLRLAFADRIDARLVAGLEQMSELTVETGLLNGREFEQARTQVMEAEGVPMRMGLVDDADVLGAEVLKLVEQLQPAAARLVRVRQYYWLRVWLEGGTGRAGEVPRQPEGVEDHVFMVGREREAMGAA